MKEHNVCRVTLEIPGGLTDAALAERAEAMGRAILRAYQDSRTKRESMIYTVEVPDAVWRFRSER